MIDKKQIISVFILSLFVSFCYYFLISNFLVYPTVAPMIYNGNIYQFADWKVIVGANLCEELGYDVYLNNPCDIWGRKHVYGEIFLRLPFVEKFKFFYFEIFPIMINYIFIVCILSIFRFKNSTAYFSTILILFSFPVMLAIERANNDILIFIFVVLLAYYKNQALSLVILIVTTISKFYPIVLVIKLFFEKNLKKIIINLSIFISLILLIFFYESEQISKIFSNRAQYTSGGIYDFSLIGTMKFYKATYFFINNKFFSILIFLLFLVGPIIYLFTKIKFFFKEKNYSLDFNFFEDRIFILSSILILICYFSFQNYAYREIFFIGLMPWVLKMKMSYTKYDFCSLFFYLLIFKFLVSIPITYIYMSQKFKDINHIFIFFKYSLDLFLIIIITTIFLNFLIKHLNILKQNI